MTATICFTLFRIPPRMVGRGNLAFCLLFFLSTHSPFICAMLNSVNFTQLSSFNGLGWYGRAVGMATLVTEQYAALQFL